MSGEGPWELFVTDGAGVRVAQIDPYEKCEVFARVNDVSTWELTLPTDTPAGRLFTTDPRARLLVTFEHATWRSGPVRHLEREVDVDGDWLKVAGVDDTVWVARRLAHPQPTKAAPPYNVFAYDVKTADVATVLAHLARVNAGEGAVASRQVPGFTAPDPVPAGPTVTVAARWQNLLALLQDTARPAGIVFDVVDLEFHAYAPVDRGAVFSAGLETLGGWKMTADAPEANKAVVAGGGEGTARTIVEVRDSTSVNTWGLAETFVDQRQTTATLELQQAGLEAIAAGVKPTSVVFTPLETPGQRFGRDWFLSDLVTVQAGGLTVHDQIRQIHLELSGDGVTVTPSVGAVTGQLDIFRTLAALERRTRQLERI